MLPSAGGYDVNFSKPMSSRWCDAQLMLRQLLKVLNYHCIPVRYLLQTAWLCSAKPRLLRLEAVIQEPQAKALANHGKKLCQIAKCQDAKRPWNESRTSLCMFSTAVLAFLLRMGKHCCHRWLNDLVYCTQQQPQRQPDCWTPRCVSNRDAEKELV